MKMTKKQRIESFRSTPTFGYLVFERALRAMRWTHQQPRSDRPRCVYVSGTNGMGKTTLIRQFMQRENQILDDRGYSVACGGRADVLAIDMSGLHGDKSLHRLIVSSALGGATVDAKAALLAADGYLEGLQVKTLILDEFSDIRRHTIPIQQKYLSHLRNISNTHKIGIIALGIYSQDAAFGADPHLISRFAHCHMAPWKMTRQLRSFVASVAMTMPLEKGMDIDNQEFFHLLLRHSEGTTDRIVSLIRGAATHAVLSGHERLDVDMLKAFLTDQFPEGCDGQLAA